MKKKYIVALIILGLMQVIRIDKTNPPVDPSQDLASIIASSNTTISTRLRKSCYDCHSNETTYPWHANIAPFSWWMKRHINNGRNKLNFSRWTTYNSEDQSMLAETCADYTRKKWMPIGVYKLMHSESKMTAEERDELVKFFEYLK